MERVTALNGRYIGETAWVIGRGPSLARLRPEHIGPGPVIVINQAVEVVEGLSIPNHLYSMQKDKVFVYPARAALLLHDRESLPQADSFELECIEVYSFDMVDDFGREYTLPSVVAAAEIACLWGCARVKYLCCDAATDGDTRAFGQPATQPQAYLMHKPMVLRWARLPVEWVRVE